MLCERLRELVEVTFHKLKVLIDIIEALRSGKLSRHHIQFRVTA